MRPTLIQVNLFVSNVIQQLLHVDMNYIYNVI